MTRVWGIGLVGLGVLASVIFVAIESVALSHRFVAILAWTAVVSFGLFLLMKTMLGTVILIYLALAGLVAAIRFVRIDKEIESAM